MDGRQLAHGKTLKYGNTNIMPTQLCRSDAYKIIEEKDVKDIIHLRKGIQES